MLYTHRDTNRDTATTNNRTTEQPNNRDNRDSG